MAWLIYASVVVPVVAVAAIMRPTGGRHQTQIMLGAVSVLVLLAIALAIVDHARGAR